ncbi:MAG: hypothetical protein R3E88_03950 [Myxococcota bacterium]
MPTNAGHVAPSVVLDEVGVAHAGIEVAPATASHLEKRVEAYGRVLDPTAAVEAVARRSAARVEAEAAARERARVEALSLDRQNASLRDVEAARVAAARAQADLAGAEARVVGALGTVLAHDAGLDALSRRLARREAVLVRVAVPPGSPPVEAEDGAQLLALPERDTMRATRFAGTAPDVDPSLPGTSYLFVVESDALPVGAPVRALLRGAGAARDGVDVPAAAVVRRGGELLVFVEREPYAFDLRRVSAEPRSATEWFVGAGLETGERVVVAGAQQLLSAESLATRADAASDGD